MLIIGCDFHSPFQQIGRAESCKQRREIAGFRKRLYGRWKTPMEKLRMLVTMSCELGNSINEEITQYPEAFRQTHLIDVHIRSHARACQIAKEIVCLLEGGLPPKLGIRKMDNCYPP